MTALETTFPAEFDHQIYVSLSANSDVSALDCVEARSHYETFGKSEGRICSKVSERKNFLQLVPDDSAILEIGPFYSPSFKRPESDVYYLDCIPTEKMLQRASEVNVDGNGMRKKISQGYVPKIDYVWKNQKFSELINRKFPVIFSSHNVEHHPCLISHLQNLESVLEEQGHIFFVVPDKRFCFDHYLSETTIADVVDAWKNKHTRHSLKNFLDHLFFTTHNDPFRHWSGDHGDNKYSLVMEKEQETSFTLALNDYCSKDEYFDVHAWKFTPSSFAVILNNLFLMGLTRLKVIRLYPTVINNNEFYVIMKHSDCC